MTDALVLDRVSKIYEVGGVELVALHDVDLEVAEEEVVTLLGPSGSGKTTLLSIAGGLLSPTTGRVIVGGKDITRARARKLTAFRRKKVGFIFQAVNLVPFLTARENLLVVAELARRDRGAAARRADRLLEELGLGHRTNNLPSQLSGGERQRVAIGRALMNQPALVLVDEPTSALDSDLGQQVMELIVSEVKARGAAAVIVTHDQRMARYGDTILTMADGRIAGMAPRPEFTLGRAPGPAGELEPGRHLRALPAASELYASGPLVSDPGLVSGGYPADGRSRPGGPGVPAQPPAAARWGPPGPVPEPPYDPRSGQFPAAGGQDQGGYGQDPGQAPAARWGQPEPSYDPRSGQFPAAGGQNEGGYGPDPRQAPAARGDEPAPGRIADPLSGPVPTVGRRGVGFDRNYYGRASRADLEAIPTPTPDRTWRRPATPPSSRSGGGRRPSHPREVPEGWPEPQPQVVRPDPVPPAPWGTPEFFATPPASPGPSHPPAAPAPAPPEPPAPPLPAADETESDRARWLQQLTPPPTKAQPRPLTLPDQPIWPTRYWAPSGPPPANGQHGDHPAEPPYRDDAYGDDYDYGEYDDE